MKKPSIIFFGTSDFAVPALEKMSQDTDIQLVISQPAKKSGRGNKIHLSPVEEKAKELGLEVFTPEKVSEPSSLKRIEDLDPDLFIVCAYGQILSKELLDIPKYGSINIHGSLLPKYRGAAPVHRAILDGEDITGVTIMLLDEGLDTGDILSKKEVPITNKTTVGDLFDELAQEGADLLSETLIPFLEDKIQPEKQDSDLASYAEKVAKEEGHINWDRSAQQVLRQINGVDPFPSAFGMIDSKRVKFFTPEVIKDIQATQPGEILFADQKNGLVISCKDHALKIHEIQYPGKKRMQTVDFFKGNSIDADIIS